MVGRWFLFGALLGALPEVEASDLTGWGRVSLMGGYRQTPNGTFLANAAEAGYSMRSAWSGGPQGVFSCGYAASNWAEVSIDLVGGTEQFKVAGKDNLSSWTYGGLLGFKMLFSSWHPKWVPYAGLMTGPVLVMVSGGPLQAPNETLETAYAATAGLHWKLAEHAAITLDYRFMYVRGGAPGIGGISGGGNWVAVGFTWFLPPEPRGMSSMSLARGRL